MAFDPYEHGLFINADGIRSSVPWKLMDYGYNGALGEEQVELIAARFALDVDRLRDLSLSLGIVLNPNVMPNLISVRRSIAAERAAKEIKRAFDEVQRAGEKLHRAFESLERLGPNTAKIRDDARRLRQAKDLLMRTRQQARATLQLLGELQGTPDALLFVAPTDKRKIRDRRRSDVLWHLFRFWQTIGRKLSYTTDPVTSERRSPLIVFVNAVVAFLSDPPATLSGETIVVELKAFLAQKDRHLSVSDGSDSSNQNT